MVLSGSWAVDAGRLTAKTRHLGPMSIVWKCIAPQKSGRHDEVWSLRAQLGSIGFLFIWINESLSWINSIDSPFKPISIIKSQDFSASVLFVHEGKKPFKCDICDYSSSQKSDLKKHFESVHEEKKSHLNLTFVTSCSLKSHMNIVVLKWFTWRNMLHQFMKEKRH